MAIDLLFGRTPRDWSCGLSVTLPPKQQKAIFAKVDDIRHDILRVGTRTTIGMLVLSGALGIVAISNFHRRTW